MLLCCVLSSGVFSTIANADETDNSYHIMQVSRIRNDANNNFVIGSLTFTPNNGTIEKHENTIRDTTTPLSAYTLRSKAYASNIYTIRNKDGSTLFEKDKTYNVRFQNVYHSFLGDYREQQYYIRDLYSLSIVTYDIESGAILQTISDYSVKHVEDTPYYDISFSFTSTDDVKDIMFTITSSIPDESPEGIYTKQGYPSFTGYLGEFNGDDKYQFSFDVESQETGLLRTVIDWLKGIKSSITDMATGLVNKITVVVNGILELPSKIGEWLINLLVPTDEQKQDILDSAEQLLTDKFGGLFQASDIIHGIKDSIKYTDITNTITLPFVSLESVGIPFSFGGYEVKIVPDSMTLLVTACKRIISIVCTFAFINALKKRYDRVMEG